MISLTEQSFLISPVPSILLPPQNRTETACKIQSSLEILQFIGKIGKPVLGWINKYIIKSICCPELI
jgi:hypothetical protein